MTYTAIETVHDYDAVSVLLHNVLNAVIDVFRDADIDLPERQYIHLGPVAQDCEQLTVQLLQVYLGTPATLPGQPVKCQAPRTAVIRVNILRKAPGLGTRGQIPSTESLTAAAERYSRDLWLLFSVPERVNTMNGSILADADPIEPAGDFAGSGLNLSILIP